MDQNELRARALRALGKNDVKQAIAKSRAIVGPVKVPVDEELATEAWNALSEAREPTAEQMMALEIVIRILRPAPLSRNGQLEDLPDRPGHNLQPDEVKSLWSTFQKNVNPLLPAIGRIEFTDGTHVGTGFLVKENLLATNRHVLAQLTYGTEILLPNKACVNLKREVEGKSGNEDTLEITGLHSVHPKYDIALLTVSTHSRPTLPLDLEAALQTGERIVAIGYPGDDIGRNPFFVKSTFGGKYGIKRASLGEVLSGTETPVLWHDCSTTGGSSGSPVFSLISGKVVGIHRSGTYLYRNEGVTGESFIQYLS